MKKYLFITLSAVLALASCHKNDPVIFDSSFICFDLVNSSSISIHQNAELTGEYWIHLSSSTRETPLTVEASVSPGDGMTEGIDYELISGSKINFLPGVYNMPYRIKFLRNPIDPEKDNSIYISITEASDPSVTLGFPGPDALNRNITITKYSF